MVILSGGDNYKDIYAICLSESVLLRAEAYVHLNNLVAVAVYINQIRNRAKATAFKPGDVNLDILRMSGQECCRTTKKIADALEVSLDYLAGDAKKAAVDKQTLKLIHDIEDMEPSIKDKLIYLANAVIRDAKTKKAYAH